MNTVKKLLSAIYPNKCMGCGDIIPEGDYFCKYCEQNIERNDLDNFCLVCGQEKENCVCKFNIYRFEKMISVFKNEGIAQRAYYSYKFSHKQHYIDFFAKEIADAVQKLYQDITFDYICAVPINKTLFFKSKFDHCNILCKSVSKLLKLPIANDVLSCKKGKKQQHKLSIKQRLTNVNEKFRFNYKIDGATVLLIDDIYTTGATLDECAKTLMYAGANRVLCATVLATVIKSKKEN